MRFLHISIRKIAGYVGGARIVDVSLRDPHQLLGGPMRNRAEPVVRDYTVGVHMEGNRRHAPRPCLEEHVREALERRRAHESDGSLVERKQFAPGPHGKQFDIRQASRSYVNRCRELLPAGPLPGDHDEVRVGHLLGQVEEGMRILRPEEGPDPEKDVAR